MAVVDILLALTHAPASISSLASGELMAEGWCKLQAVLSPGLFNLSMSFLTGLWYCRYRYIVHPLTYQATVTMRRITVAMVTGVVISFLPPATFVLRHSVSDDVTTVMNLAHPAGLTIPCNVGLPERWINLIVDIFLFGVCTYCIVRVLMEARKHRVEIANQIPAQAWVEQADAWKVCLFVCLFVCLLVQHFRHLPVRSVHVLHRAGADGGPQASDGDRQPDSRTGLGRASCRLEGLFTLFVCLFNTFDIFLFGVCTFCIVRVLMEARKHRVEIANQIPAQAWVEQADAWKSKLPPGRFMYLFTYLFVCVCLFNTFDIFLLGVCTCCIVRVRMEARKHRVEIANQIPAQAWVEQADAWKVQIKIVYTHLITLGVNCLTWLPILAIGSMITSGTLSMNKEVLFV
uniref:G-protein coupled receptors family 1 profile domain-containing protein n=1 Tax=Branchiostoma floridae TaxID=7739 RepID=C3ZDX2_BRAFL|eukprot:XP_002592917.1 hypothetical protein BRAFLDRAFT_65505 [Branchiostoma floridae]